MDGRPHWLYVDAAVHASFVAVDEQGTEAAAATSFTVFKSFEPQQPREFKADHPFLFLIRQRSTGSILFLGRLANPTIQ